RPLPRADRKKPFVFGQQLSKVGGIRFESLFIAHGCEQIGVLGQEDAPQRALYRREFRWGNGGSTRVSDLEPCEGRDETAKRCKCTEPVFPKDLPGRVVSSQRR